MAPTSSARRLSTIGVTFYHFRNNTPCPIVKGKPDCTGVPLRTDSFIVHCHPSATVSCTNSADWASEARITPTSFDMRQAPVARGFFVGDYEALAVAGNKFKPFFVQSGVTAGDPSDAFFVSVGP